MRGSFRAAPFRWSVQLHNCAGYSRASMSLNTASVAGVFGVVVELTRFFAPQHIIAIRYPSCLPYSITL